MQRFFIHQEHEGGCGLAAFKMLLATHFQDQTYLYEEITKPVNDFLTMVQLAKERGIELVGYDTLEDKVRVFNYKQPLIVQLLIGEEYHFVFAKRIGKSLMRIADPKYGMIILRRKQFLQLFTGKFLIAPSRVKSKKKRRLDVPKLPKKYYLAWILSLIGVSSLLMAFYYVDDGVSIYRPLIFLVLAFVFAFLEHLYLLLLMKEFQARYLDEKIPLLKKPYLQTFHHLFTFKKNVFYRKQKTFTIITTVLIIAFLLILNGVNHLLAFIFIGLLAIAYDLLMQYFRGLEYFALSAQSKMVAALEKRDISKGQGHYAHLNALSHRLSEKRVIINFFIDIILFSLAFLIMSISQVAALNYLLFHFLIYRHLFKQGLELVAAPGENSLYVDDYLSYRNAYTDREKQ
ncbi:MAG: cysteine peptidase family C39 domain-containing protein [Bacilli bacterium]